MRRCFKNPFRLFPLVLLIGCLLSCGSWSSQAQSGKKPLRPSDLLESPNSYLNREVEIEIVEPLSGPSTPAALAAVEYGQVRIDIPDGLGTSLALVPAAFKPEDPKRYQNKFDRVISGPIRVRGEFLSDDDLGKQLHRRAYVIRAASIEALTPEPPVRVASLAELKSNPARWDRKNIVYEGLYKSGFEVSALDGDIWLSTRRETTVIGKPPPTASAINQTQRVRVTGILFAKPGTHYGHLGGYGFELLASKLEYLGP